MEKQLKLADELFDSIMKTKKIFTEDMADRSKGLPAHNTPYGYVTLLQNLYQVLCVLDLQIDEMEKNISKLDALSFQLRKAENFSEYATCYYNSINSMLLRIIQYREYYCIIRRNEPIPGLGSHIITNLGQIAASLTEGYIPVIDMVNVNNSFSDLSRQAGQNAWELFFEQPFGVRFSYDLMDTMHIIKKGIPSSMPNDDMNFLTNPSLVADWKWLLRIFMPFSSIMNEEIHRSLSMEPFNTDARILGVLARGTDYTALRPYNYPAQPTVEEVLVKAEEVMHLYQCEYIYLATEDSKILSAFEKNFKDKLVTTQKIYYSGVGQNNLAFVNEQRNIDVYQKNTEYLTALYLLSQCDCFIGGRTSGSVVSLLFSEHFDYFYVWNKGRYGIDDMFYNVF